jgi:hypothetical protein
MLVVSEFCIATLQMKEGNTMKVSKRKPKNSNRLEQLALEIKECLHQARKRLPYYREAGIRLLEARPLVPQGIKGDGGWVRWLAQNFDHVNRMQAWNYMRLAEHWSIVEPVYEKNPDLGLMEANAIIAKALEAATPAKPPTLLETLESVLPGTSVRETVDQSTCFQFQDGKVSTFNDEQARIADVNLDRSIKCALPAETPMKLLKKVDEEMAVAQDGVRLTFTGTNKKATFAVETELAYKLTNYEDGWDQPIDWKPVGLDFADALRMVIPCAAMNHPYFYRTCVHLTADYVEATDNLQMCRYYVQTGLDKDVLVRADQLEPWCNKPIEAFGTGSNERSPAGWLALRTSSGCVAMVRQFNDDYPDISKFFQVENADVITFPKKLVKAVERARPFVDARLCPCYEKDKADAIIVVVEAGKLTVHATVNYRDEYEE